MYFFFNATATTEIYTLSLHDALPISLLGHSPRISSIAARACSCTERRRVSGSAASSTGVRSEEHTSELQSLTNLVCRLLLEKKQNLTPPVRTTNDAAAYPERVSPAMP